MGYSTSRVCVYRTSLAEGVDGDALQEAVRAAGARVMALNDRVSAVDTFVDGGDLVTLMEFRHKDQWWIKRKAPHVAVAILVQGGVDIAATHLVDIVKPEYVPPRP